MKGLIIEGNSRAAVREVPVPAVKPGWALVRIEAAGLCGSDLHFYHSTPEELGARRGTVVGHEPAGVVAEVGDCVTAVQPGDRVSVYHWLSCGHCRHCRAGYRQFCEERVGIAAAGYGSSTEYVLAPEANCLPLPDALSFADGALMACCAATAYAALHKVAASGEDNLVIFGLGPVGLSVLTLAQALGARTIGIEVVPERLELGRALGADVVIDARDGDVVSVVREATAGRGAPIAIETSGAAAARDQVVRVLAHRGRGVYIGLGNEPPTLDPVLLIERELVLMGSYVMPIGMYDAFARFLVECDVHPERIVTHRFPITRGVEAIELFDSRRTGKVVLVPG
jgi:threonine dehydrogenase-like Zn-dependent dehydrogenase